MQVVDEAVIEHDSAALPVIEDENVGTVSVAIELDAGNLVRFVDAAKQVQCEEPPLRPSEIAKPGKVIQAGVAQSER